MNPPNTEFNHPAVINHQPAAAERTPTFSNRKMMMLEYEYEDHQPSPKHSHSTTKISSGLLTAPYLLESTETSDTNSPVCLLKESDFPPIPADRQARKHRFRRRGGEGHSALLRASVMASMDDGDNDDDTDTDKQSRRSGRNSSISLQSLQEALLETPSPRKRARHAGTSRSISSIEFESEEDETPGETDEDEGCGDNPIKFSDAEEEDEEDEDDEQILRTSADMMNLVMNNSIASLRKQHHRSYSVGLNDNYVKMLDSSITSLPDFRSHSTTSSRRQPSRRWVSRRTSYDSWASVCSDYSAEDDDERYSE